MRHGLGGDLRELHPVLVVSLSFALTPCAATGCRVSTASPTGSPSLDDPAGTDAGGTQARSQAAGRHRPPERRLTRARPPACRQLRPRANRSPRARLPTGPHAAAAATPRQRPPTRPQTMAPRQRPRDPAQALGNCTAPAGASWSDAQAAYAKWKSDLLTSDGAHGFLRVLGRTPPTPSTPRTPKAPPTE